MRILHLSDLHLTDAETTLRALWNGPAAYLEPSSFDFIIISGDLSQKAEPAEYTRLGVLLREDLLPLLKRPEYGRIVMVPGNHDVSWGADIADPVSMANRNDPQQLEEIRRIIQTIRVTSAGSQYRLAISAYGHLQLLGLRDASHYASRFSAVQQFFDEFYTANDSDAPDPIQQRFRLTADPAEGNDWSAHVFPEDRIAFIGFNTCYQNDRHWHGAHINPEAIAKAGALIRRLRVKHEDMRFAAVWHHGMVGEKGRPDFLSLADVGKLRSAGITVGFHGHTHYAAQTAVDLEIRNLVVSSVGSLAASAAERPGSVGNQYAIVRILPWRMSVDVFTRNDLNDQYRRLPRRAFRLPSQRAEFTPVESNGFHALEQRRAWTVATDGVSRVAVSYLGLKGEGRLPLAVLRGAYSDAQPVETLVKVGGLPGRVRESRRSDGAMVFETDDVVASGVDVAWRYDVGNAVALDSVELAFLPRRLEYHPTINEHEEDVISHVLRVPSDKLTLSLHFGAPRPGKEVDPDVVIVSAHPVVERPYERGGQRGWERVFFEESHIVSSSGGAARASADGQKRDVEFTFDEPEVGWRYGIAFTPRDSRALGGGPVALPPEIADVSDGVIRRCRNAVPGPLKLSALLTTGLKRRILEALEIQPEGASPGDGPLLGINDVWTVTLWDRYSRVLSPIAGEFPARTWNRAFEAGTGVAGHCFRFVRTAGWDSRKRSLIYQRPRTEDDRRYGWILCVPIIELRTRAPVGVVGFAGAENAAGEHGTKAGLALSELARNASAITGKDGDSYARRLADRLRSLETAVAGAFWGTLVKSDVITPLQKEAIAQAMAAP